MASSTTRAVTYHGVTALFETVTRWRCVGRDQTCMNEARYYHSPGAAVPVYCSLCDMLENGGRGERASDRAARLVAQDQAAGPTDLPSPPAQAKVAPEKEQPKVGDQRHACGYCHREDDTGVMAMVAGVIRPCPECRVGPVSLNMLRCQACRGKGERQDDPTYIHDDCVRKMLARLESLERAQPVRQRQFERLVWLLCNQAPTQDQAGTDQWKRRVLDVLTSMDYPEERREQMRQLGDPGE